LTDHRSLPQGWHSAGRLGWHHPGNAARSLVKKVKGPSV